jgi:hypothetical protein
MADEAPSTDLFDHAPPSPPVQSVTTGEPRGAVLLTSVKAKFEALIHAHFPALVDGGVEIHQPHRQFLLDLHDLLP